MVTKMVDNVFDKGLGLILLSAFAVVMVPLVIGYVSNLSLIPDNPLADLFSTTIFGLVIFGVVLVALIQGAKQFGGRRK